MLSFLPYCADRHLQLSTIGSRASPVAASQSLEYTAIPQTVPRPDNFLSPPRTLTPTVKAKIWKLALTRTQCPNRSTSINFVHVNGRSLYIVHRRMVAVVEGGNVLHTAPAPLTKRVESPPESSRIMASVDKQYLGDKPLAIWSQTSTLTWH